MAAEEEQQAVDTAAERLDRIADRAVLSIDAALRRAMDTLLKDLKRLYQPFLTPTQTSASGGRANAASIAETASRLQGIIEVAQSFMSDAEIQAWQARFQKELGDAMALGGELAEDLRRVVNDGISEQAGEPNQVAIWTAAQIAGTFIRGETAKFRNELTQIVTDGVARGRGFRSIEKDIRAALMGSSDSRGITTRLGLRQRAELIARSELSNAYVDAQRRTARQLGSGYVRWIATKDERTCPLCVSRHGQVYRVNEVVAPAHPRCRCGLSAVIDEAINEKDPAQRDVLLEGDYWRDSREQAIKELQDAKEWTELRTRDEVARALRKITPSERYRNPDAKTTVMPAVRF